ncbi:zinc-ribbon domain-containing protein [Staphylococcus simulans]|uniref:zinc-ribbon domain-containing protein n=4 Tax=Staphylococcus simulans TaxID=1286 RepID=UPI000E678640|nr:zinc-ribbon domain-containing protein [Staphylococcus simulans]RIN64566.1 zinc-ribbon domain-containing protein [Staphylococcus simulans]
MKFCPECGNKLIENAKFCPECGFKIPGTSTTVVNETSSHIIETKTINKVNSDEYVKNALSESHMNNINVRPDIPEKKLVNASVSIAENTDPNTIIALIDTSILSNGKAGVVFTGNEIFIKQGFEQSQKVPFKNLQNADYDSETSISNKGKVFEYQKVTVNYQNGESIILSSQKYGKDIPYKFLAKFFAEFDSNVDEVVSKNQVVQLSQMNPEIIKLYFRIIIAYLKDDDGIIDSREYKELVSLMTKVKVTKAIAKELREYRFDNKEVYSIEELIDELKSAVNNADYSEAAVEQSLGMDIITMNSDKLDELKKDEVLMRNLNRLNISDKQINFTVRKIKTEKQILEKRLTDSQVKEAASELAAVASGAGVSLGALAVTGAISGSGVGLSAGIAAITGATVSSGGLVLGLAAGYGAYKGIKYLAGTGEAEKFGIRIQALQEKIKQLRVANSYIIEDINWLSNKSTEFAKKLKESNELSDDLYKELEYYITQNQFLADTGSLIEDEEYESEYELLKTNIPETLDIGKYNELLVKEVNKVYVDEVIKDVYIVAGDLDNQSEVEDAKLREDINLEDLEKSYMILEQIGYFDTTASSIAQGKSLAKKGFSSIKKSLFSGEYND